MSHPLICIMSQLCDVLGPVLFNKIRLWEIPIMSQLCDRSGTGSVLA